MCITILPYSAKKMFCVYIKNHEVKHTKYERSVLMKVLNVDTIPTIQVEPVPIHKQSKVSIHYNGYLRLDPSSAIYFYYGYGPNGAWEDISEILMQPSLKGVSADIYINNKDRINFCFHNDKDQWDNNFGNNWSFEIID
jgi:hypothetical protein